MKARGTLAALLLVALALLSACGDDSASSAADAADTPSSTGTPSEPATDEPVTSDATPDRPDWPACETVWVEGGKIPTRYQGCLDGDSQVASDNLSCSSGQRIVRYQEKFFGVAGGTIYEAMGPLEKDKQYLKMVRTCRG